MTPARAAGFTLFAPSLVWACGACTDTLLARQHWWSTVLALPALVLAIDCAVVFFARVGARRPVTRHVVICGSAFVCALVASFLSLGSMTVMMSVLAGLLFLAFVSSIVETPAPRGRSLIIRCALLSAAVCFGLLNAMPGHRTTAQLVRLAASSPRSDWSATPLDWSERELLSRTDAVQEVERQLSLVHEFDAGTRVTPRELSLLRAHRLVGGSVEVRQTNCQGWTQANFESNYKHTGLDGGREPPWPVVAMNCGLE